MVDTFKLFESQLTEAQGTPQPPLVSGSVARTDRGTESSYKYDKLSTEIGDRPDPHFNIDHPQLLYLQICTMVTPNGGRCNVLSVVTYALFPPHSHGESLQTRFRTFERYFIKNSSISLLFFDSEE